MSIGPDAGRGPGDARRAGPADAARGGLRRRRPRRLPPAAAGLLRPLPGRGARLRVVPRPVLRVRPARRGAGRHGSSPAPAALPGPAAGGRLQPRTAALLPDSDGRRGGVAARPGRPARRRPAGRLAVRVRRVQHPPLCPHQRHRDRRPHPVDALADRPGRPERASGAGLGPGRAGGADGLSVAPGTSPIRVVLAAGRGPVRPDPVARGQPGPRLAGGAGRGEAAGAAGRRGAAPADLGRAGRLGPGRADAGVPRPAVAAPGEPAPVGRPVSVGHAGRGAVGDAERVGDPGPGIDAVRRPGQGIRPLQRGDRPGAAGLAGDPSRRFRRPSTAGDGRPGAGGAGRDPGLRGLHPAVPADGAAAGDQSVPGPGTIRRLARPGRRRPGGTGVCRPDEPSRGTPPQAVALADRPGPGVGRGGRRRGGVLILNPNKALLSKKGNSDGSMGSKEILTELCLPLRRCKKSKKENAPDIKSMVCLLSIPVSFGT